MSRTRQRERMRTETKRTGAFIHVCTSRVRGVCVAGRVRVLVQPQAPAHFTKCPRSQRCLATLGGPQSQERAPQELPDTLAPAFGYSHAHAHRLRAAP
eukprot:7676619-Alexandrium_andersonii.AAC.1